MDIKRIIKKRGMTISEVADKLGVSQSGLSQMLAGNPSTNSLRSIAEVLDCSIADFFADEPGKLSEPLIGTVCYDGKAFVARSTDELRAIADEIDGLSLAAAAKNK